MRLAYQELQLDRKKEEKKLQNLEGKKREQAERLGMGLPSRRYLTVWHRTDRCLGSILLWKSFLKATACCSYHIRSWFKVLMCWTVSQNASGPQKEWAL